MIFKYPQVFFLILLIPLLIFQTIKNSKKTNAIPLSTANFFDLIKTSNYKTFLLKLILPIRIIIILLMIFAISRPQAVKEKMEVSIKGVDIMLALDTSESMLAKDLTPKNRLEAAKEVIAKFVKRQKDNRIGLVVFSGSSFTLSPLTFDYDIILDLLSDINVDTVRVDGTAIGDAITNSLYRFNYSNNSRNKVIILLTDGENNSGNVSPEKASSMSSNKKVKIYTIGIGKPEPTYIPRIDPVTGQEMKAKDAFGQVLVAKINESSLKAIAKATQGEYFRAIDTSSLENIYNKINMIEKGELEKKKLKIFSELYLYFLIPAFILSILELLLSRVLLRINRL